MPNKIKWFGSVVSGSTQPEHNQVVTELGYWVRYCKENGRK